MSVNPSDLVTRPRRMIVSFDIDRIDKPIRILRKFLKKAPSGLGSSRFMTYARVHGALKQK